MHRRRSLFTDGALISTRALDLRVPGESLVKIYGISSLRVMSYREWTSAKNCLSTMATRGVISCYLFLSCLCNVCFLCPWKIRIIYFSLLASASVFFLLSSFFNRVRHIDPHKPIFKPNERETIPDGIFERGSKIGKKIILVVHRYS